MVEKSERSPNEEFDQFLIQGGLMRKNEAPRYIPLSGGVSSDIWLVQLPGRKYCIKRALAKLKVADNWCAPISRNATEVAWLQTVSQILPDAVPEVLAHDPTKGIFVMPFIPPKVGLPWKKHLSLGKADFLFAGHLGKTLGTIHSVTAEANGLNHTFATDETFHAIRLEPYLETTARRHPDLELQLTAILNTTATTKHVLVHGDVSPKNILVCKRGPLFIDAECAWWGDPAFDLAFCLNHLFLKCILVPESSSSFLKCFRFMYSAYLESFPSPMAAEIECRTAHLLPGLLLARVDGKSPVEYITKESEKEKVRKIGRNLLIEPVDELLPVMKLWAKNIGIMI